MFSFLFYICFSQTKYTMEIKIEVYTFKVRERGQTEKYDLLNNVVGEDFMVFINRFISQFDKNLLINKKLKKSFQIIEGSVKISKNKRMIAGIIESGEYGDETKIVTQKGKHKFTKESQDLAIRPFYFLINVPVDGGIGYILLQRTGVHGINNLFQNSLREFFELNYKEHKIDIAQFLSKELVQQFISKGGIQEVILTRYNLPKDVTSKLKLTSISQHVKGIQIRIMASAKNFLGLHKEVNRFLDDPNAYFFDALPFKEMGFDNNYDVAVKVKNGNKTRVIDLSDSGQIRPYYDIDKDVKKDPKTGHAIFESIDSIAVELLNELTALRK